MCILSPSRTFANSCQVKTFSPVRSQDRRNLLCSVTTHCPSELSQDAKELLVPRNLMSARFSTTSQTGVSSKSHAKLYVSDVDGPLWVDLDDGHILPSLLTVWRNPYILPIVHTFDLVIENLQNGADLMLRGMVPPFDPSIHPGSAVAVATSDNPTVPVAIGVALIDLGSIPPLTPRSNLPHGKAVQIVTVIGDELCNLASRKWKMPFGPLDLSFPKQQDEIKQDDKDKDTDTDMEQNPAEETAATQMESLTIDTNNNNINNIAYTTSDIDNAYFQALRQALYKHNQNITHMDLPMGSSQFMSGFILPNIPIPAPIPPIKKSSYKKASKFLKVMEKSHSGLVKVKEKGNDVIVLAVAPSSHQDLKDFQPFRLPNNNKNVGTIKFSPSSDGGMGYPILPSASRAAGGSGESSSSSTNKKPQQQQQQQQQPVAEKNLIELYQPKSKSLEFFKQVGIGKDAYLTPAQLRQALIDYIGGKELVNKENPKLVLVDSVLASSLGIEVGKGNGKVFQSREWLIDQLKSSGATQAYYMVTDDDDTNTNTKPHKGSAPRIVLTLEKRQGRKIVSKVANLPKFNIDVNLVAQKLRVECAASTTIDNNNNNDSSSSVVIVQGPHTDAIARILNQEFGIRKQWVHIGK